MLGWWHVMWHWIQPLPFWSWPQKFWGECCMKATFLPMSFRVSFMTIFITWRMSNMESTILLPHQIRFVFRQQFKTLVISVSGFSIIHRQPCHVTYTEERPVKSDLVMVKEGNSPVEVNSFNKAFECSLKKKSKKIRFFSWIHV